MSVVPYRRAMDAVDAAKTAMLEHDLRGRGITDADVLRAMSAVPRESFVDPSQRRAAYADRPLPIGEGQTISQPYIVALMAQELMLGPRDRVLDVGTGSGYAAAVMAQIVAEVWSIERHGALADLAAATLEALGVDNVHVVHGDGTQGWPDAAPYDAISVAAAATRPPPALLAQLADGGRLVLPIGRADGEQHLVRVIRHGDTFEEHRGIAVRFVPLVAADVDQS